MGKKPIVFVTYENEKVSIKTAYLTWNADVCRCSYFELGLPVVQIPITLKSLICWKQHFAIRAMWLAWPLFTTLKDLDSGELGNILNHFSVAFSIKSFSRFLKFFIHCQQILEYETKQKKTILWLLTQEKNFPNFHME